MKDGLFLNDFLYALFIMLPYKQTFVYKLPTAVFRALKYGVARSVKCFSYGEKFGKSNEK